MENQEFIGMLRDLKENRRLSSESEAIMKPYVGKTGRFSFSFVESSTTFSSRVNDKYAKGKTVLANFIDNELECSILFPPSQNDWVENLSKGDEFNFNVEVLELDNLYQRVVFGQSVDIDKRKDSQSFPAPVSEGEKISEVSNLEEEKVGNENTPEANEESKTSLENVDITYNSPRFVEEEALNGKMDMEEDTPVVVEQQNIADREQVDEVKNYETVGNAKVEQPILSKKVEDKVDEEESPPPIPSLSVQRKAKEIDHAELERIRDKRYDQGVSSLTKEEKEILSINSIQRKKSAKINTRKNSSSSSLPKGKPSRIVGKEEENIVGMGCRGAFGFIVGIFGLQALVNGWTLVAIITLGVAWYLFKPLIDKFK